MKTFELIPADGRKSFYHKCYVTEENGEAVLYSYNTKILSYDITTETITPTKYFNYSATTKRHQKAFYKLYNIPAENIPGGKKTSNGGK